MRIGCLILASGQGKRFGSNKLLADLCGRPHRSARSLLEPKRLPWPLARIRQPILMAPSLPLIENKR